MVNQVFLVEMFLDTSAKTQRVLHASWGSSSGQV